MIANLTGKVREPARDLPRAIFFSLGITTLLYGLVSLAVVVLATPHVRIVFKTGTRNGANPFFTGPQEQANEPSSPAEGVAAQ